MSSYCLSTENDCGKNTFHIFAPTLELWGKAEKNGWSLFWSFVGFISCGFRAHVWRQILSDLLSSERERARITHEMVTMTATITKEGMCDVNGNFSCWNVFVCLFVFLYKLNIISRQNCCTILPNFLQCSFILIYGLLLLIKLKNVLFENIITCINERIFKPKFILEPISI